MAKKTQRNTNHQTPTTHPTLQNNPIQPTTHHTRPNPHPQQNTLQHIHNRQTLAQQTHRRPTITCTPPKPHSTTYTQKPQPNGQHTYGTTSQTSTQPTTTTQHQNQTTQRKIYTTQDPTTTQNHQNNNMTQKASKLWWWKCQACGSEFPKTKSTPPRICPTCKRKHAQFTPTTNGRPWQQPTNQCHH